MYFTFHGCVLPALKADKLLGAGWLAEQEMICMGPGVWCNQVQGHLGTNLFSQDTCSKSPMQTRNVGKAGWQVATGRVETVQSLRQKLPKTHLVQCGQMARCSTADRSEGYYVVEGTECKGNCGQGRGLQLGAWGGTGRTTCFIQLALQALQKQARLWKANPVLHCKADICIHSCKIGLGKFNYKLKTHGHLWDKELTIQWNQWTLECVMDG